MTSDEVARTSNFKPHKLSFAINTADEVIEQVHIRDAVRQSVEGWEQLSDSDIILRRITSGLTNRLWRCTANGLHVLVRIYGNQTEKLIDREKELKILGLLYQAGEGPKLYGTFKNGYIYGYFEGRPLEIDEYSEGKYNSKIANYLGKWHKLHIDIDKKPLLWSTINKWLDLVPPKYATEEKQKKFETLDFKRVREEVVHLEKTLSQLNSPIVFCHDDMLSGNVIVNDETGDIHLIDYEYACYNFRAFDIANHFCEWAGFDGSYHKCPTKEQQIEFYRSYLKSYSGVEPNDSEIHKLYLEVNKYMLASHFYWGSWGLAQAHISEIDFDFLSYGLIRFNQFFKTKDELLALQ